MTILIATIVIFAIAYTIVANIKDSKEDWTGDWSYHPLMAKLDREAENSPVAVMLRNIR